MGQLSPPSRRNSATEVTSKTAQQKLTTRQVREYPSPNVTQAKMYGATYIPIARSTRCQFNGFAATSPDTDCFSFMRSSADV
jgi:hypothetical protein